jgi:N-acetylmuramoyl-L-alanine amidase
MTTLDNGIVIEEHINAHNFTRAADCPYVFGFPRSVTGGTVHWWGAYGQNFDDVVKYLASNNARGSSAHFVLQEDRVACIVTPDDAAWHAGNAEGNAITIGIECRPEMTPGDLETLGSLLRFLETIYGSLNIYIHSNWANTACPGTYANEIDNLVAEINGVEVWHKVENAPQPPAPEVIAAQPEHHCCCHD